MSPRPESENTLSARLPESGNDKNGRCVTKEEVAMGVPEKVPTIVDLKNSIPAHCFKPDLLTSFYYMFKDYAIVGALYLSMLLMERQPYAWLTYAYMPIYWYVQGTIFASVFCIGHDAGHESFSASSIINDIVGNITHTSIMVPYYPWKLTHKHHHKNTGNIDKDEVYYPVRESAIKEGKSSTIVPPYFFLGVGWYAYSVTGYSPRPVSLYMPFDPFYGKHTLQCIISLTCNALWLVYVILPYYTAYGFAALFVHYLAPLFGFASWIVFITFLHHHDNEVPWYADEKWDYVRGQLSSIDRNYGWCHDLLHNIGTHQIHHMFSKVPHYHLEEATAAFRAKYPELVRKSDEHVLLAFIRLFPMWHKQSVIPDDRKIHVYKDIEVFEKEKAM